MEHHRPAGVSIIAILQILGGLALLGLGALFLFATSRGVNHPVVASALGAVFLVLGLLALVLSFGLWTGKRWAWMTTIVLQAIVLLLDLVLLVFGYPSAIVGLILSAIIIYYLTRPHVKAYFQRSVIPTA